MHPVLTEMTFAPMDEQDEPDGPLGLHLVRSDGETTSESDGSDVDTEKKVKAVEKSLARLQSGGGETSGSQACSEVTKCDEDKPSTRKGPTAQATIHRRKRPNGPDAVIVLKEERVCFCYPFSLCQLLHSHSGHIQACTFHDFLKFVYPQ